MDRDELNKAVANLVAAMHRQAQADVRDRTQPRCEQGHMAEYCADAYLAKSAAVADEAIAEGWDAVQMLEALFTR